METDNLLYLPHSGTVVACDFGVGFIANSGMKPGPRGALKYYPLQAIDNSDYYTSWCDEYFVSLSLLEILMEKKIYPDLNVSEIKELRKNGIRPDICPDLLAKYPEAVAWIHNVWSKMGTN